MSSLPVSHKKISATVLFTELLDFLFPGFCVVCSNPLPQNSKWFCSDCEEIQKRKLSSRKHSLENNISLETNTGSDLQKSNGHLFNSVLSFFQFDSSIQKIVHNIKYRHRKNLAEYMGSKCFSYLPEKFIVSSDFITEVPLHPLRKIKRGYNQAEYFARGICRASDNRLKMKSGLIKRKKYTKTQTRLDSSRRKENVRGVFRLSPGAEEWIKGRDIILADDVVTTGATVSECAKVLLNGGAESVKILSLARA